MIRAYRAVSIDENKIVIDGKLDEEVWQKAPWQGEWHLPGTNKITPDPASVAFAFDSENLYVGVKIAGKINGKQENLPKDNAKVWHINNDELFLANPGNLNAYRQFVVNACGNLCDGQDGDGYINFDFLAATQTGDDSWTAEFAIPWKTQELDPAKVPALRVNLAHTVWVDHPPTREAHGGGCWSLFKKGYREPKSFGFVLLVPPEKAVASARETMLNRAANVSSEKEVSEAIKSVQNGSPAEYIDYLNRLAALEAAILQVESRKAAGMLDSKAKKSLLTFPWDVSVQLE